MEAVLEDFKRFIRYERRLSGYTVDHYAQILKHYCTFLL